jgi:tRNA(Ile)-lysidine synthase
MKSLIKKIKNDASLNDLWSNNSKIIIGVSGGPDSVCLLDILAKIKDKSGTELHIAHVNYNLRKNDSEKDEKLVQKLAEKYQICLSVLKSEKIRKNEINEENLRKIRYDFFEKIRRELKYDLIAVAHNQDDQVETFFLHLIRGAGLQGLSGMKYKNGKIIRPLLGVSKKEVTEYLKNNKLDFRIDRTNQEDNFFRNKVRNKLIPILQKNFNANIKKTISDSISSIADDLSFISKIASEKFEKIKNLKASEILKLHPALQKRLILEYIKEKKGNLENIESAHVREISKIVKSTKNKSQTFSFQGLKLERKGDRLNLLKN